jgi:hypothetical protein
MYDPPVAATFQITLPELERLIADSAEVRGLLCEWFDAPLPTVAEMHARTQSDPVRQQRLYDAAMNLWR